MAQNKVLTIEIDIEKELRIGVNLKAEIRETIFTDYDRLMNYDELIENIKLTLKKLSGYHSLTVSLLERNESDYSSRPLVLNSYRYIDKYKECKRAKLSENNMYDTWIPSDSKEMPKTVKNMVDQGNKRYIELLKEINVAKVN